MTSSSTPTVTKSPPALIPPAGPTPRGTLALSSIDKTVAGSGFVCLIQVFSPPSPSAARRDLGAAAAVAAMREGFARALVPYYPVAGRVAPSGLAVDCTGEGIWFVEAAASCALADVDGLECCPLPIPQKLLLPRPPPGEKLDGLIFMVQATRFTCGGFAVGIIFRHAVFDGQGAAQFLTAAGELARGLKAPSVAPVWDRDAIPDPPGPLPGQVTEFRLVTQVADISAESIARVKDEFKQASAASAGEVCSTFDAVTAIVFKCRTLALASALPDDDAEVRVAFAVSTRRLLRGVLPIPTVEGYYGNCVFLACVARAGKAVREAALAEVVGAVREAKEAVPARFAGWMRGVEQYDVPPLDYSTVTLSDWTRLGLDEVDYGFGVPGYVSPLNDHDNFIVQLHYVRPPAPRRGGVRVVLRCVEEPHAAALAVELAKFA
ncbi:acyl transferase 7-like [Triticum urartu]|uniref:3'-N-debenzoyl-2'-deoxytaxol N-benzoyltransferase n=1 Tax=Triticum urartu TaxID=4572 RepID=A0A8R7PY86_TRIUA|nr:acyl transferase 7-like [Triticum urartu]